MTGNDPTFGQIRRIAGEAGHVSYDVDLLDADGTARHFSFSGSIFVGPVVVTCRDEEGQWNHEVVHDPRRFGEFVSPDWVHRFLAAWHEQAVSDQPEMWRRSG